MGGGGGYGGGAAVGGYGGGEWGKWGVCVCVWHVYVIHHKRALLASLCVTLHVSGNTEKGNSWYDLDVDDLLVGACIFGFNPCLLSP